MDRTALRQSGVRAHCDTDKGSAETSPLTLAGGSWISSGSGGSRWEWSTGLKTQVRLVLSEEQQSFVSSRRVGRGSLLYSLMHGILFYMTPP